MIDLSPEVYLYIFARTAGLHLSWCCLPAALFAAIVGTHDDSVDEHVDEHVLFLCR